MPSMAMTNVAFATYRATWKPDQSMHPDARRYAGDADQMARGDGLCDWLDGSALGCPPARKPPPFAGRESDQRHLWVVTADAVLHAPEKGEFGSLREATLIKHSNLTGGGRAYSGGNC